MGRTRNPTSCAELATCPSAAELPTGERPVVCIQGLGFVGTAMALAAASARDGEGHPRYNVIGVDLNTETGRRRVEAMRSGQLLIESADHKLRDAMALAAQAGNLFATVDHAAYAMADVVIVDINLNVSTGSGGPSVDFRALRSAVRVLGQAMKPGSLLLLETTVPPGTCARVIAPELQDVLAARGLPKDSILLAHSYERVMPGTEYYDSIVNFWRVYAGHTPEAADACERFLATVVNARKYPLTRLPSTTASEIAKVLENSYRAVNIAFMEEWGRFAEAVAVDLFEVIEAIRTRPTHSNIRQPGFGVGGYCLTKDPFLALIGARDLFHRDNLTFPFCGRAVATNRLMPLVALDNLERLLGGSLSGKRVLLLGISYRPGVADTRYSPSEVFVLAVRERGGEIVCHDPLVTHWTELELDIPREIPDPCGFDAVVFAVPHDEYLRFDLEQWLRGARPLVLDANAVLTKRHLAQLGRLGCRVWSIGRGALNS